MGMDIRITDTTDQPSVLVLVSVCAADTMAAVAEVADMAAEVTVVVIIASGLQQTVRLSSEQAHFYIQRYN
jgi:hypothetical protein